MIDVTAAIVQKDGKILICQRPEGKNYAMLWEFPGGKVEPNETLEDCLKRELKEELDFKICDLEPLTVIEKPEAGIRLHFFFCSPDEDEPKCLEHNQIVWAGPQDLDQYSFCPSDQMIVEQTDPELLFGKKEN